MLHTWCWLLGYFWGMENYRIFHIGMLILSFVLLYMKFISLYDCIQMQLLTAIITYLIKIDNKLK